MHNQPAVSVVTVTWNSGGEIMSCIESVSKSAGSLSTEIIVIDNNSSDDTVEKVLQAAKKGDRIVRLVENNSNEGYTKACNKGILLSTGKYVLLLNPDTEAIGSAAEQLASKLEGEPELGAVAPQLLNGDGTVQSSCRTLPGFRDIFLEFSLLPVIFPSSRFVSRWKMGYFGHDKEQIVEQPMAAALMVRRSLLEKLGGFDERFFMFFNDVDLCKRIIQSGHKILFFPEAKFRHEKGVSVNKSKSRMIDAWNRDCIEYFRKHFEGRLSLLMLNLGLRVSGALRKIYHNTKK